jgi:nitrile hydratase
VSDTLRVGDRVRARPQDNGGHTRLPRYIQGREGTLVALHGVSPVPDEVAAGHPGEPEPVYAVRFEALDLWGTPGHTVTIELWHSYLDI